MADRIVRVLGPMGLRGPPGPIGEDGPDGAAGAAGSVWRDGAGVPDNGTGINGDYYLRTSNGDVYLRSAGTYSVVGNIKGATGATGSTGPAGVVGSLALLYSSVYGWNGATLTAGWTDDLGLSDTAQTSIDGFPSVLAGTVIDGFGARMREAGSFPASKTLVIGLRARQEATGGGPVVLLGDGTKYVAYTAQQDRLRFRRYNDRDSYSADEDASELGSYGAASIYWAKVVDTGTARLVYWYNFQTMTPPPVVDPGWQTFAGVGITRTTFLTADRWGFGAMIQTAGGTRKTGTELIHAVLTDT